MVPRPTSLNDFFATATSLLDRALDDPEFSSLLLPLGHHRERITEGKTLLVHVRHLHQHLNGHAAPITADPAFIQSWEVAEACYRRSLEIARLAFRQDPQASVALDLHQERLVTVAGWLKQTGHFYGHLRRNAAWAETLAGYGYGAEGIEAEAVLADAVRHHTERYRQANNLHPQGARMRDARLVELDAWLADFRALCRIALAGNPRLRAELGLEPARG